MKFKGNIGILISVYVGFIASTITTIVMSDDKKLATGACTVAFILISVFFLGFNWIKEFEIIHNKIIFRRIFWSSEILIKDIKDVKWTKRKFIINRKKKAPINFYLDQIKQKELGKFCEFIEKNIQ
ncbi:hypothetical protein [Clostridium grantii]|uniref:PH domain-containing protein n=1 Tax=Clostridium grantii DSM 8605 TaxID=1121316 RepID=A0A1M5WTD0_9CLOT|nr:hypothetical protein [Clostridium grantii]SHH90809.1 hypothetical protein SAMN02745207_03110 [Clostridium grantii DSM 8605]